MPKRRREPRRAPLWKRLLAALGYGLALELALAALAAALIGAGLLRPRLMEPAACLAALLGALCAAARGAGRAERLRFPTGLGLGLALAGLDLLLGRLLGGGSPGWTVPAALAAGTLIGALSAAGRGKRGAGLHKMKRTGTRYSVGN